MKKLNKAQKKHIKDIFKKVLNITCYILSAICILTYLIVGLQSCKSAQGNHAESAEMPSYVYSAGASVTLSVGDQTYLSDGSFDCDVSTAYPADTSARYDVYYDADYYIIYNGDTYECNGFRVRYAVYWRASDDENYFRVESISFDYSLTGFHDLLEKHYYSDTSKASYLDYDCLMASVSVYGYGLSGIPVMQLLFTKVENGAFFTFNKDFNYNAPAQFSINSSYMLPSTAGKMTGWHYFGQNMSPQGGLASLGGTTPQDYLAVTPFVSNGQLFDRILYETHVYDGILLYENNDYYVIEEGGYVYHAMYYYNSNTMDAVLVNYRNEISSYSQEWSKPYMAYLNSTTWVNDSYRYLQFLGQNDDITRDALLAFNNNNQNAISPYVGNNNLEDVFSLISLAFTSVLPVLGIIVLPGITLGVLLFIPLVAMLVFAIIRIIKK